MEIITGIASEIGKTIVQSIGTQFGYLIHYDENIRVLEEQAKKLADLRADLQRSVEAEERKGEVVDTRVRTWLTSAHDIIAELEKVLKEDTKANPRCLKGWCPNLKSRYSVSKKAKNKSKVVAELQNDGALMIKGISTPAPPPKMESLFPEVKTFESRRQIIEGVLQSLKVDRISMIGICGMGGVGKTTMVKEVIKIVESEKVFKDVVMAVVSQTPDARRIQGEIADRLGLKFDVESVRGRAEKLHERLNRCESVLIILDDVWGELDLEEIGIPSSSNRKGCKIVLTSRSKDVLTRMKSQQDFTVAILSEGEAWDLFVETAGNSTKQSDLLPIAKEVAKECGGLPLAIVTVGKALRSRTKEEWSDACDQLKQSSVTYFTEMDKFVFSRIKFSYDFLGDEDKSCFLLCCLFPEDSNIPVEHLVQYGVGLNLFEGIDSLNKARNRAYAITEKLKSSSLLLDGDVNWCVKLHDVVRDAAISIVSKGERVFLVRHDDQLIEWPNEDKCKHCTAISLSCGNIKEYPDATDCPKLELLQLMRGGNRWGRAPFSLPKGMEKLKGLAMERFTIGGHPSSLEVLTNLQSLSLHYCELDNLCFLGALERLGILSLAGSEIKNFSQELGQLRHLKLLDLTDAGCDERIAPGILSNLSQLEELYLIQSYGYREKPLKWESINEELKLLSRLRTLSIDMFEVSNLPKNYPFDNLIHFSILFCPAFYSYEQPFYRGPNYLAIGVGLSFIMESGINRLLKKAEILYLENAKSLKNGLYELDGQGFPCLKDLTLHDCGDLEHVIDAEDCTPHTAFPLLEKLSLQYLCDLKEIWHGQLPDEQEWLPCFGNMRYLEIKWCSKLKNIIPLSIARGLVQLQCLGVKYCENMEEIFSQEENQDGVAFPDLSRLELWSLPKLISFCKVTDDASPKDPSLNHQVKSLDGQGSSSSSRMDRITEIQQDLQFEAGSSSSPSKLHLVPNLHILLTSQWVSRLPNVEELIIHENDSLEAVFDLGGLSHHVEGMEMLAQLTKVNLERLSKLTSIWMNVPKWFQGLGNLQKLRVENCDNLTQLFPPSIAKLLVKLQRVKIINCSTLESIVARETEEGRETYSFEWPSLKKLVVRGCEKMKTLGSTIPSPRKVKNIKDAPASSTTNDSYLGRSNACPWSRTVCSCLCPKLKSKQRQKHEDSNFDEPISKNEVKSLDGQGSSSSSRMDRITEIQQDLQFEAGSSSSPSKLHLVPNLHILLNSQWVSRLPNLEELIIHENDSLEAVFDLGGLSHHVEGMEMLAQLTKVNLERLSKLTSIWMNVPKWFQGLGNLQKLRVENCHNLTQLFPPSIAKLLVKLQRVKIINCSTLESIVARETEEGRETYSFEWPSLKKLVVGGCEKMKTLGSTIPSPRKVKNIKDAPASSTTNDSYLGRSNASPWSRTVCSCLCPKLKSEQRQKHEDSNFDEPISKNEIKLLDSQGSSSSSRMDRISEIQQDLQFEAGSSSSQSKLHLVPNLHILLDSQWVSRLPNLEVLIMHENDSWEAVFDLGGLSRHAEERKRIEMLAKLTEVYLVRLSKLTSIWMNVPKGFQGLRNLQKLRVENCHNLTQLFPASIAKLLAKLQQVEIEDCSTLESIVAREIEEGRETYNFEWPSLEKLVVKRCEQMKTFGSTIQSPRKVSMSGLKDSNLTETSNIEEIHSFLPSGLIHGVRNLQLLELDSCASIKVIFDLSAPNEDENHGVLALNALESLMLRNLQKLMHIWKVGPKNTRGFQNLKWLIIKRCNSLRNFIPLSIAKLLVMLEMLEIDGCESMEEVIVEQVKEEKMDKIAFPKLNYIRLQNLLNLASFYSGGCNIEFPFLTKMTVVGCPKLKMFVSSNVTTPNLQEVFTEHADYPLIGDLNNTIQNIFDRQGNKFHQGISELPRQIH